MWRTSARRGKGGGREGKEDSTMIVAAKVGGGRGEAEREKVRKEKDAAMALKSLPRDTWGIPL